MKLHGTSMQPQFGFGQKNKAAGNIQPPAGFVDVLSVKNGKEVRQHVDLSRAQADRMLEQTMNNMALQTAMLHHQLSHLEDVPALREPLTEDVFTPSKHHHILER